MVSLREMARMDAERVPPTWLGLLLKAKFFETCPEHPDVSHATRNGSCNFFCTTCADGPLCHACISNEHDVHKFIEIQNSSGNNVMKAKDVEGKLNVEEVQPYLLNNEEMFFLAAWPQTEEKIGERQCKECDRALLHEDYHFCSLGCKFDHMEVDFGVSFVVQSKKKSEPSQDDASSHRTRRLRKHSSKGCKRHKLC